MTKEVLPGLYAASVKSGDTARYSWFYSDTQSAPLLSLARVARAAIARSGKKTGRGTDVASQLRSLAASDLN